jgi:D-beta-D-heptose 7-phosphate kinase/D-beta-D-heptose 1-phosphate adenosyltransferase
MIIRIDSGEEKIQRIDNLQLVDFKKYDAVVISDYNKGFLTEEDIQHITHNHELVFLDTKKWLGDWAKDVPFVKINEVEYKKTQHTIQNEEWTRENLIITVGSRGCVYKDKVYPVEKVEIKDLSGAGDSFLAALVYGYLKNKDIGESIKFANRCATQVVQQKGVTTIHDI